MKINMKLLFKKEKENLRILEHLERKGKLKTHAM